MLAWLRRLGLYAHPRDLELGVVLTPGAGRVGALVEDQRPVRFVRYREQRVDPRGDQLVPDRHLPAEPKLRRLAAPKGPGLAVWDEAAPDLPPLDRRADVIEG